MARDPMFELLDCWDDLNSAIDRMVTALPQQMTAAAELLEAERQKFRAVIQGYAFNASHPTKDTINAGK